MTNKLLVGLIAGALVAGCSAMRGGDRAMGGQSSTRTAGELVDDATIGTQLKAKYAADPELSALKINIDTTQGNVRLKGEVKSFALRKKAEDVARGIKGVKSVDNQLIISG